MIQNIQQNGVTFNFVLFAPLKIGGVLSYVLNFGELCQNWGHSCSIVLYGNNDIDSIDFAEYDLNISKVIFTKFDREIDKYKKLYLSIKESNIIIANDSLEIEMCNYFRCTNDLIYALHGENSHYEKILTNQIIDYVICDSDYLKNKYFERQTDGCEIVYPIVPEIKLSKAQVVKRNYNQILYIGRLDKGKGGQIFLDINIDDISNYEWIFIVSNESFAKNLVHKILNKRIYYDINPKNILELTGNVGFLLFPSLSEGFGMVVLECMRLGIVPIIRDIESGISPLLTHGVDCFKFKDAEDLDLIFTNINNSSGIFFEELSKNVVKSARELFSPENSILKILEVAETVSKLSKNRPKNFVIGQLPFSNNLPRGMFRILVIVKSFFKDNVLKLI